MAIFSLDILGLFIFIAGFVIGLGAVTVIDIHWWGSLFLLVVYVVKYLTIG